MNVIGISFSEQLCFFNDIQFAFKYIRGFYKISLPEVKIFLQQSITRGAKCACDNASCRPIAAELDLCSDSVCLMNGIHF